MRIFTLILLVIILILFAIFMILNGGQNVDIRFFAIDANDIPLFAVVLFSFLIGAVFVLIVGIANEIRIRTKLAKERRENQKLKEELDSLRNLAVEEGEEE